MKGKLLAVIPILISLVLCIAFGTALLCYAAPMEALTLNLSLTPLGENPDPAAFDSKGWTVYTQEGNTVTELDPDGFGGYLGVELGQTIYFSRELKEELDDPTLQLDGPYSEFTFSVFLDGKLIYTDYPGLDNRVGHLKLPMSAALREEPVKLSLPRDYEGKTLTIAQSTPEYSETGSVRAYPANVMLYCGYAYESTLIAESFAVFSLAVVLFLTGAVLLVVFVLRRKLLSLFAALLAMLWMCAVLMDASFHTYYFGYFTPFDMYTCLSFSCALLMAVLAGKAMRFKPALWALTLAFTLAVTLEIGLLLVAPEAAGSPHMVFLQGPLSEWIGTVSLLVFLILGLFWRKECTFYRVFTTLTVCGTVAYWCWLFLSGNTSLQNLADNMTSGRVTKVFFDLLPPFMVAMLMTILWEALHDELDRHTEQRLIKKQKELAYASYEHLRHQQEEVMMLRHDMLRHFHVLYDMTDNEKRTEYLAGLIGRNEKIRPIVESGNEMLDIILNGRLGAATDTGVHIDLIRAEAPEKLPLSDYDLCALVINIIDNAIAAASTEEEPYIRLNIHERDGYLALMCENSYAHQEPDAEEKTETVPKHGLGLKIMGNIVKKYEGVILTEADGNSFTVKVVIPLT